MRRRIRAALALPTLAILLAATGCSLFDREDCGCGTPKATTTKAAAPTLGAGQSFGPGGIPTAPADGGMGAPR